MKKTLFLLFLLSVIIPSDTQTRINKNTQVFTVKQLAKKLGAAGTGLVVGTGLGGSLGLAVGTGLEAAQCIGAVGLLVGPGVGLGILKIREQGSKTEIIATGLGGSLGILSTGFVISSYFSNIKNNHPLIISLFLIGGVVGATLTEQIEKKYRQKNKK